MSLASAFASASALTYNKIHDPIEDISEDVRRRTTFLELHGSLYELETHRVI